jgi:hypothetical protein
LLTSDRGLSDCDDCSNVRFLLDFLDLRATAGPALRDRLLALDAEIAGLAAAIAAREAGMNALV